MRKISFKRTITVLLMLVVFIMGIIAIKNDWIFSNGKDIEDSNNITDLEETKEHNTITSHGEAQIELSQMIEADQPVIVEYYFGKETEPIEKEQIIISDYYYSRKLDSNIKVKNMKEKLGEDIFDNNGMILKDYYYLYVEFNVKNIGTQSMSYLPKKNQYIEIDKKGVVDYKMDAIYSYVYRLDANNLFGNLGMMNTFNAGDSIQFELVYLISEEAANKNDICIYPNRGETGIETVSKKENRFIVLDLVSRER